jgi:uncharacterized low-complexity protein
MTTTTDNDASREKTMRALRTLLAVAFTAAISLTASSVGSFGEASAKAHVTKGKPGKCGPGKFYSKKDKGCISKGS